MSELVIKYDDEVVFEGTAKNGKLELGFHSGFDALLTELDDEMFPLVLVEKFTEKAFNETLDGGLTGGLMSGALASMAASMMCKYGSQKKNPPADPPAEQEEKS